jgi:hypothetical protein
MSLIFSGNAGGFMQDPFVKERERTRIPDKYQWDLSAIYSGDEAWEAAKQKLISEFARLSTFASQLS